MTDQHQDQRQLLLHQRQLQQAGSAAGEAATTATTIQTTGATRISRAARDATGNGALRQSRSCFLLLDLHVGVGNSVQERRVYVPEAVWADCGDARCLPVLDACLISFHLLSRSALSRVDSKESK